MASAPATTILRPPVHLLRWRNTCKAKRQTVPPGLKRCFHLDGSRACSVGSQPSHASPSVTTRARRSAPGTTRDSQPIKRRISYRTQREVTGQQSAAQSTGETSPLLANRFSAIISICLPRSTMMMMMMMMATAPVPASKQSSIIKRLVAYRAGLALHVGRSAAPAGSQLVKVLVQVGQQRVAIAHSNEPTIKLKRDKDNI